MMKNPALAQELHLLQPQLVAFLSSQLQQLHGADWWQKAVVPWLERRPAAAAWEETHDLMSLDVAALLQLLLRYPALSSAWPLEAKMQLTELVALLQTSVLLPEAGASQAATRLQLFRQWLVQFAKVAPPLPPATIPGTAAPAPAPPRPANVAPAPTTGKAAPSAWDRFWGTPPAAKQAPPPAAAPPQAPTPLQSPGVQAANLHDDSFPSWSVMSNGASSSRPVAAVPLPIGGRRPARLGRFGTCLLTLVAMLIALSLFGQLVLSYGANVQSVYGQLMQGMSAVATAAVATVEAGSGSPVFTAPPAPTVAPTMGAGGGLRIDGQARVVTNGASARLRPRPGTQGMDGVRGVLNGTEVLVLEGPVEADNYRWWKVRAGQFEGWMAETLLEPLP